MFDFFVEKILPVILLLVGLVVFFIIGLLPVMLALEGGAMPVAIWGLATTALITVGAVWFTHMMVDDSEWCKQICIVVGVLAAACTFYPSGDQLLHGHSNAAYYRTMAPQAQAFALAHFDQIDANHSGLITDDEMATAEQSFTGDDGTLIAYMRAEQSEMGHVTSSYTTTTYVWISTGNGGGYMSPITTTYYTYGINRGDLSGYTQRMIDKYRNW